MPGQVLEKLQWPLLQAGRMKARVTTFYDFHNGLIHIDSKHLQSTDRQGKSRHHTLSHLLRSALSQETILTEPIPTPRPIPECKSLPEEVAAAPSFDLPIPSHRVFTGLSYIFVFLPPVHVVQPSFVKLAAVQKTTGWGGGGVNFTPPPSTAIMYKTLLFPSIHWRAADRRNLAGPTSAGQEPGGSQRQAGKQHVLARTPPPPPP